LFADEEAHALFSSIHKHRYDRAQASTLFARLGYLPLGIAVAAGVLAKDPGYTLEGVVSELPPLHGLEYAKKNLGDWFGKVVARLDEGARALLQAMACCAPGGWDISLAREVAEQTDAQSVPHLRTLLGRSLVEVLDWPQRYRLHALVRLAAAPGPALRQRHAVAVGSALDRLYDCPPDAARYLDEVSEALATPGIAGETAVWLASRGGLTARNVGRLAEAMALFQKEERICDQLGHRADLQISYGNQASILSAWGRLDEAMALLQKKECICEDLGNRAGLQASYSNQASILEAWGRLDEAMALLQKAERICEDLGDRAGLQACYGNQAVIVKAWGRLDEAMALLQKKECICENLGNRAGLGRSYGNQAIILTDWGRLDDAMVLLKKVERICDELGDLAGLHRTYGNQADILLRWGHLEDAIALIAKKERICQELGDRAGVAHSLEGQGLVLIRKGDPVGAGRLIRAALAVYREMRLQRDIDRAERDLRACESILDT
jgi:tetratricopeptide (TPR) repeat protein